MKTVLLVNPDTPSKYCYVRRGWADWVVVQFIRKAWHQHFRIPLAGRCTSVPPITLLALKALLERSCRTIVIDEQVESINFGLRPDLVCVTSTTPQYGRARQIAAVFRSRGVPTAVGGIHATCLPEQCAADFDTVCVGEAEAYIEQLVADLHAGRLKPLYRADAPVEMERTPFLEYDVAAGTHLPFYAINFSRGCVFDCEFCSVRPMYRGYRTRSVESVVRQIERVGARQVYFADASLMANRQKARELLKALVPLRIRWFSCMTLNVAQDPEMMDLLAESGCWFASVGFETLSQKNLIAVGKPQNCVESYREAIRAFHQRKIAIEGNFVFGFDGDTENVFEPTAEFTIETGIDLPEFYILTPYPGTRLFARLTREGRIVDWDWSHYDNAHFRHLPVYEPKRISPQALLAGCRLADRIAYSPRNMVRRLCNSGMFSPPMWLVNYLFVRHMRQRRVSGTVNHGP